jgi:hypothetical protein
MTASVSARNLSILNCCYCNFTFLEERVPYFAFGDFRFICDCLLIKIHRVARSKATMRVRLALARAKDSTDVAIMTKNGSSPGNDINLMKFSTVSDQSMVKSPVQMPKLN